MDNEQNGPIEEGSLEATNDEGVRGVVEQVRADIGVGHTRENVLTLLHERFVQSRLEVSAEREEQLADELLRGV